MSDYALDILQRVLDTQASAGISGDIERIVPTLVLPYRRCFLNLDLLIETPEDLRKDIEWFISFLLRSGANNVVRLAAEAEVMGEGYISGLYVTHALRNTTPVIPSYQTRAVLQRQPDGRWAFVEFMVHANAIGLPIKSVEVPLQPVDLPDLPASDARRLSMDAVSIYQRFLDAMSDCVARDDFETYTGMHHFPFTAHGSRIDQEFASPDQLRDFYDVLRSCISGEPGDRIVRTAQRAEFVGADVICGYHVARVFKGDNQSIEDVDSRMILKREGARWRLITVSNSIENTAYPFDMYEPGGILRPELEIQQRKNQ